MDAETILNHFRGVNVQLVIRPPDPTSMDISKFDGILGRERGAWTVALIRFSSKQVTSAIVRFNGERPTFQITSK